MTLITGLSMSLSTLNPVPQEGIDRAIQLMETGVMYRYSCTSREYSEVALFEKDFAEYTGAKFALAVNSCGSALYIALLAVGVKPGDDVLLSAFTYTAVPSAIVNANANPILIECDEKYCIDTEDLIIKITDKTRVLVLSYMRGHISNIEDVMDICSKNHITLIEDCAHSVGATYKGIHTGRFGKVGCFSTQSHKMLNSGEGGLLITDDEEIIAKAILYSGSQETFWVRHFVESSYLAPLQEYIPNISARMSNLTAAILRSQIPYIGEWVEKYKKNYSMLVKIISQSENIFVPEENDCINRGPDTIQFNLQWISELGLGKFIRLLDEKGIGVKSFGANGNPRYYKSWKYVKNIDKVNLPQTDAILKYACDIRLPLGLSEDDIRFIGETINCAIREVVVEENSNSQYERVR